MKIKLRFGMTMLMLLFWFVSCAPKMHLVALNIEAKQSVIPPVNHTIQDTPRTKQLPLSDQKIIQYVERRSEYSPTLDTLFKRNLDLEAITIRTINRAYDIRIDNDSLKSLVHEISRRQLIADSRANAFYKQATRANYYAEQNKTYSENINWQFWVAFVAILLILAGQSIVLNKIRKTQKTYA